MTDESGGLWLTWPEAAERLGIKAESVQRRARARKWPRRPGNDGRARVLVPPEALTDNPPERLEEAPPALPPAVLPDESGLLERAIRAETRAEVLAQQVEDLRGERDRLLTLLEARNVENRRGFLDRLLRR